MVKLTKVQVYCVRSPSGVAKYFRTLRGALGRVAWLMIAEKYGGFGDMRELREIECTCYDVLDRFSPAHWNCPLHNRQNGYFRRLHDRLASFLVMSYLSDDYPARLP